MIFSEQPPQQHKQQDSGKGIKQDIYKMAHVGILSEKLPFKGKSGFGQRAVTEVVLSALLGIQVDVIR